MRKVIKFDGFCKELKIRKVAEARKFIEILLDESINGAWLGCDRSLNSRLNLSRPAQKGIVNKFVEAKLVSRSVMPRSGVVYRINRGMAVYLLGEDVTKSITDNGRSGKVQTKKVIHELYQKGKNGKENIPANFTRREKREKVFCKVKPYNSIYYTIDDKPLTTDYIKKHNIKKVERKNRRKQPHSELTYPFRRIEKNVIIKNQICEKMDREDYRANLMDVVESIRKLRSRVNRKARKLNMEYYDFMDSFLDYCYNYGKEIRRNGAGVDKLIDIHANYLTKKKAQEAFSPSESAFQAEVDYLYSLCKRIEYTGTYRDDKYYGIHASGIPIENHEENERKAFFTILSNKMATVADVVAMINYSKYTNDQNFFPNFARYEGQWWRFKAALAKVDPEITEKIKKKLEGKFKTV